MRLRLVLALLVLAAGPARAGNITVEFEGMLTLASGIEGADVGTLFSGTYSYDDGAALQLTTATSGVYAFGAAFPASGFSLTIHAPTPVAFSGGPLRDITVGNTASADSQAVVATTVANGDFRLDFSGGPGLFSSLDLAVPDLSQSSGMLQYTNLGAGFVLLMGSLTSLAADPAAAPEPSGALLLALGFAALAWRRTRV